MNRVEEYKQQESERFTNLLKEEMLIRANAAAVLSQPFTINGVQITEGCDKDGTIKVYSGIDRLAGAISATVETTDEERGDYIFTYTRFKYNGIKFEQLTGSRQKGGNENE